MSQAAPTAMGEAPLLGRAAALGLWRRLRADGVRRVLVVGPPGVGKSSFVKLIGALEGVVVHDLAGGTDVPKETNGAELLLLDGADALTAAAVDALTNPAVVLVAHRRLEAHGEQLIELEPLEVPGEDATPPEVAASVAVQVFLSLARALDPELAADATSAPHLAALVRAVDGLPGPLALVARRVRVLGLSSLVDRLRDPGLLRSGGLLAPFGETLGRALERVSPRARLALAALALCPDALETTTAEALVGADDSLDVLSELRDASLLVRRGDRLHVPTLIRRAALDRLSADALGELTREHASRLAGLARSAAARYVHVADATALRWLVAEHRNLQAALDSLVGDAGQCAARDEETAWGLTGAILLIRSRYSAQDSWQPPHTRIMRFAEAVGRIERAPLAALVQLAVRLHALSEVGPLERVVDVAWRRAPDDPGVLWIHASLAAVRHDLPALVERAERAAEVARETGAVFWEARAHGLLIVAHHARGAWAEARDHAERGLRCAEAMGSEAGVASALPNLVFLCARLGERHDAERHAARAIALAERLSDLRTLATTLANLAYVRMDSDDLDGAEALLRRALDLHLQMGRLDFASLTQVSLARTRFLKGDHDGVESQLVHAERRLDHETFAADRAVVALWSAGIAADLLERRRDWASALDRLRTSLEAHDPRHAEDDVLLHLGRCAALSRVLERPEEASAFEARGALLMARCVNPPIRVAFEVYVALGVTGPLWPACAVRLASLARVPLAGAPATEGHSPAFHSSLAVRAALAFVWPHLGPERRADVEAAATDPGREALIVGQGATRVRPPGGEFVDVSHRPVLVRLLRVLTDARTGTRVAPLTEADLVHAVWPEERILASAATNRLHNALSLLRRAGLEGRIVLTEDGYVLDPAGRVIVLHAGPGSLPVSRGSPSRDNHLFPLI